MITCQSRWTRANWRHGYAAEASNILLRFGFVELGLSRMLAMWAVVNVRSMRLLDTGRTPRNARHVCAPGHWCG